MKTSLTFVSFHINQAEPPASASAPVHSPALSRLGASQSTTAPIPNTVSRLPMQPSLTRRPRRTFLPVVTTSGGPTVTLDPSSLPSLVTRVDVSTGNQVVPEHPSAPVGFEFASRKNVMTEDQVVPARPSAPVDPGFVSRDSSPVHFASSASFSGVPRHSITSAEALSARTVFSSVMHPQLRPDTVSRRNAAPALVSSQDDERLGQARDPNGAHIGSTASK